MPEISSPADRSSRWQDESNVNGGALLSQNRRSTPCRCHPCGIGTNRFVRSVPAFVPWRMAVRLAKERGIPLQHESSGTGVSPPTGRRSDSGSEIGRLPCLGALRSRRPCHWCEESRSWFEALPVV